MKNYPDFLKQLITGGEKTEFYSEELKSLVQNNTFMTAHQTNELEYYL